jgi:hypothetical protein
MLRRTPTVKKIAALVRLSTPLTFASVFPTESPPGFEALSTAMTERCAITIVYDRGSQRPGPRKITPRLMLEVNRVAETCIREVLEATSVQV